MEPRIALATGLTVTRLPLGALNIVATEGPDAVALRSDEPGWLTLLVGNADINIDGEIFTNGASIPMPKGAVTINMLGGDDVLFLNPMVLPGSLTVNDPSGLSSTLISGLVVKGSLTINGSTGDDSIYLENRLSVGKDFNLEFNGGVKDRIFNEMRGLSFTVGGNFRIHGTADATFVALGFSEDVQRVRVIDPTTEEPVGYDEPLALREIKIGRDLNFEVAGLYGGLLLSAAETKIVGRVIARATGAGGDLDYFHSSDGPLRVTGGVRVEAGGGSSVFLEGLHVTIGAGINLISGTENDFFTVVANNTMKLPKTTLLFGDGTSNTRLRAGDAWSLAGALTITAGSGDDALQLLGPGKVTGNVTGEFGTGKGSVLVSGDGAGRMSIGPLFKINSLSQVLVDIYNSTMNGRVEVIGHGGDDVLVFDSVKVLGAVVFTGSAGLDAFIVDDMPGYLTPSSFLGPVTADMGDHPDQVVIGRNQASGRVTFASSVIIRGIMGESYTVADPTFAIFKKTPVVT